MCKKLLTLFLLITNILSAQVGINTTTPNTTLSVNGGVQFGFKEINSDYTLTETDHFVVYINNNALNNVIPLVTLPEVKTANESFTGRVYKIKNASDQTIRLKAYNTDKIREGINDLVSYVNISPGYSIEVVNNENTSGNATWELTLIGAPKIYRTWTYKYIIENVDNDYLKELNTRIDVNSYTLSITGFEFKGKLRTRTGPPSNYKFDIFGTTNVYPFIKNGTWHIFADLDGFGTYDGSDGTWVITVQVNNMPQGNMISNQIINLGGGQTGDLITPPNFE